MLDPKTPPGTTTPAPAAKRPWPPADNGDDPHPPRPIPKPADASEQDAAQPLLAPPYQPVVTVTLQVPIGAQAAANATANQALAHQRALAASIRLNEALVDTAYDGDLDWMSSLLDQGANPNYVDMQTYHTALIVAMDEDDWPMMELLLARGADPDQEDFHSLNTPLMVAVYESKWKAMELLVTYGANEDLPHRVSGLTPWAMAYRQGDGPILAAMVARRMAREEEADSDASTLSSPPSSEIATSSTDLWGAETSLALDGCATDTASFESSDHVDAGQHEGHDTSVSGGCHTEDEDPAGGRPALVGSHLGPAVLSDLFGTWSHH